MVSTFALPPNNHTLRVAPVVGLLVAEVGAERGKELGARLLQWVAPQRTEAALADGQRVVQLLADPVVTLEQLLRRHLRGLEHDVRHVVFAPAILALVE